MALGHILSKSISRNERFEAHTSRPPASLTQNLNRLVSAAVVSPRFQQLLLSDPATAVAIGYNGEQFHLTPDEYAAVTSVNVSCLRDFAAQLIRRFHAITTERTTYVPEPQAEFRLAELAVR